MWNRIKKSVKNVPVADLGDEIELQKDDLFISWDDFLDLAACEKQLKLYGKCERKTADKLTDEERKTRTNEDMNKLYVQGRYFERRHVQPFLNQVDVSSYIKTFETFFFPPFLGT